MRKQPKRNKDHRTGILFGGLAIFGEILGLYHLCHSFTHGDRRGVLGLPGGMRVGAEREASIVVTQHGGNGFRIHAVLQHCRGNRVPEFMKF